MSKCQSGFAEGIRADIEGSINKMTFQISLGMQEAKKNKIDEPQEIEFDGIANMLTTADMVLRDVVYPILSPDDGNKFTESMKSAIDQYANIGSKMKEDFIKAIKIMESNYKIQTGITDIQSSPDKIPLEKMQENFSKRRAEIFGGSYTKNGELVHKDGVSEGDQKILQATAERYVENIVSIVTKGLKDKENYKLITEININKLLKQQPNLDETQKINLTNQLMEVKELWNSLDSKNLGLATTEVHQRGSFVTPESQEPFQYILSTLLAKSTS